MWKKYFAHKGRCTRSQFWARMPVAILLLAVAGISREFVSEVYPLPPYASYSEPFSVVLAYLPVGLVFWPSLFLFNATLTRRLHDRGKSAVWYLWLLVPVLGWLWLLVKCGLLPGTPGPNKYGPAPASTPPQPSSQPSSADVRRQAQQASTADEAELPGTPGSDRYGPAPVSSPPQPSPQLSSPDSGRQTALAPSADDAADGHLAPHVSTEEIDRKYQMLMAYSEKARQAEALLDSVAEDLRTKFKAQAVQNPDRVPEIAEGILAEALKRAQPFEDARLNSLYKELEIYGPAAQAEFKEVIDYLGKEADPEGVRDDIAKARRERLEKGRADVQAYFVVVIVVLAIVFFALAR
jgi:uncharacterized membrane protein YhaH (DUF805 family)